MLTIAGAFAICQINAVNPVTTNPKQAVAWGSHGDEKDDEEAVVAAAAATAVLIAAGNDSGGWAVAWK